MSDPPAKQEQKGKAFERLVAAVQKKLEPGSLVEWDVKRAARSGVERQIDVLVRGRIGMASMLIAIEAKDRTEKININMVGDFRNSMEGVKANKGIMVSNWAFTEDALIEAAYRGIDTCVLRPAKDEDWEGYLRQFSITIRTLTRTYKDAEIELANGSKIQVDLHGFTMLKDPSGGITFFDLIVSGWLSNHEWEEGQLVEVPAPPGFTIGDEDPVQATILRFRPGYIDGMTLERMIQRPEDWVFVKHLPNGVIDEKHFFEFKELDRLADEIRREKERD